MPERLNKRKAAEAERYLTEQYNPTRDAFQRIKQALGGAAPIHKNVPDTIYNAPSQTLESRPTFAPESFQSTTDTSMERQRADEILNKLRNQRQPPQAPSSVPGDIQALMDQAQDLETRQEFEQLDPEDMKKLQRIKEMLRQR